MTAEAPTYSTLDAALQLAAQGFHVFPIAEEGRTPAIMGFPQRATRDPEQIRKWWVENDPVLGATRLKNYNIGISTTKFGDNQSLLVVDVDVKKGKQGAEELQKLDLFEGIPPTRIAKTPSGGQHLFYVVDEPLKTGVNVLGNGLDTRSGGGYVVAAGSVTDVGAYSWENAAPLAPAPDWMKAQVGRPAVRNNTSVVVIEDTPAAIERARQYLLDTAPVAIKGAGGDATTYDVACAVRDFGVSELTCLEMMFEHWNPRCPPGWSWERLGQKVTNAYRYAKGTPGAKTATEGDFEPVMGIPAPAKKPTFQVHPIDLDEAAIPRREWVLGRVALRKKVTVVIAPPGVGKSTQTIGWALATITGRQDIAGLDVHAPGPAIVINNEDDSDELKRRIAAVTRHFSVDKHQLQQGLQVYSGVERPFLIARRAAEGFLVPGDRDALVQQIKAAKASLVVVDPFLETHEANENDNGEINRVAQFYRQVAVDADCAVVLVHHTRKPPSSGSEGHAGNMDSGRGASSLAGVARIVVTLYDMDEKAAGQYGIAESLRHEYVRLDDAKANLSLKTGRARWYRKRSVTLLNGDEVGVLEPVQLVEKQVEDDGEIMPLVVAALKAKGEITIHDMARRLLEEQCPAYLGDDKRKVVEDLKKRFRVPRSFDNWKIWYEQDERPHDSGTAKHWLFGHVEASDER